MPTARCARGTHAHARIGRAECADIPYVRTRTTHHTQHARTHTQHTKLGPCYGNSRIPENPRSDWLPFRWCHAIDNGTGRWRERGASARAHIRPLPPKPYHRGDRSVYVRFSCRRDGGNVALRSVPTISKMAKRAWHPPSSSVRSASVCCSVCVCVRGCVRCCCCCRLRRRRRRWVYSFFWVFIFFRF